MKITNETKVGILAAFSIASLIIGYNFLKGNSLFSSETLLYARYSRVDGLAISKPVLINGFQIGRVDKLILQPDGSILATLKIKGKYDIPKSTIARLESTDLLGSKAIVMALGTGKDFAQDGDTLNSNVEKNLMETVQPVQKKAELIIGKMDSILTSVNSILNPDFQKNVNKSFNSIAGTLASLEGTSKKVDGLVGTESKRIAAILANAESISGNLKNNNEKINAILNNINKITDQVAAANFKQTIDNANKAVADLQGIVTKVNDGKGSLGLLVNDTQMYDNLNNASKNLDNLIIDLKANPKRYVHFSVFGGGGSKKDK
ncbi:phospholipid/cholesterol/gamma-HCH transport system substrate-binding protein [Pedobacter cryoconitis]|uniref:Phospholipid/cholesterol/gamma-HCH transport system substrate-binding protein n=1 Tax=Pedobacter cryoconitis TaxID=188932 RepID=A0A7W8YXS5_9SPHI|nr:MlaD family protein [Pedobacter cryoconitis]MBB5623778.1 phospholipid/cholesterol/gamma-HCH transport system substrate-binding protein [Pedobacter cryoconitis]MBB5645188.1 phospholipid/cholesterol/gamma-HCH transport system substrate-binding protein [Pedobacter cryoconitis]